MNPETPNGILIAYRLNLGTFLRKESALEKDWARNNDGAPVANPEDDRKDESIASRSELKNRVHEWLNLMQPLIDGPNHNAVSFVL